MTRSSSKPGGVGSVGDGDGNTREKGRTFSLLVIDDEHIFCEVVRKFFVKQNHRVAVAYDGQSGLWSIRREQPEVVLLDLRLPDIDGLKVLTQIKEEHPGVGVVMITGYGDMEIAVEAIKLSADDFILKPPDFQALSEMVARVADDYRREAELTYLNTKLATLRGIEGRPLLLPPDVRKAIKILASNVVTNVVITGETGTGKGVVANLIHMLSERKDHEFVDINCAGLSGELLESELFGHERGAFTDASSTKRGLFEVADKGSLFLDEIGEMSLAVQAKVLKVIEDKSFRRVGGTATINVDVRVIAATNQDLEAKMEKGEFRRDLFYRLNVIPLQIPLLRERREDILPLARLFLKEFNQKLNRRVRGISAEADGRLESYRWPGNIRELRNVMERAVVLCQGSVIQVHHLPGNLRVGPVTRQFLSEPCSLAAVEARHIRQTLDACEGTRSKAAAILGIHRATLIKKIKKYGIE